MWEKGPSSAAFRCVESLKTIIQIREYLPRCHRRSSNDKCKIACKWQGAQLISADLKFCTLALHLELRPNSAQMGSLTCKLDRRSAAKSSNIVIRKKYLAIKWKWNYSRTKSCEWSRHGRFLECETVKVDYRWRILYNLLILFKAVILICDLSYTLLVLSP